MDDNKFLQSVERLQDRYQRFGKMTGPQQAAFRATLTTLLKQVEDPDIKAILEDIREDIGEPESRSYAKLTRLLNSAKEEGKAEDAAKLEGLQETMIQREIELRRQRILARAKARKSGKGKAE